MIIGKIAEKSRAVGEFCGKVQAQRFLNTETTESLGHARMAQTGILLRYFIA